MLLLGSNLLTGYIASGFNDSSWERYIEQVAGPTYRNVGFEEGYYRANYDFCLQLLRSEYHYKCLEAAILQYESEYHKRAIPGNWDWQRVKGNDYH